MKGRLSATLWFFVILLAGVATDQATKFAAFAAIPEGSPPVEVIRGVLHISRVENSGALAGMFAGRNGLFIALSAPALLFVFYLFFTARGPLLQDVGLALLAAGIVGNLIDRVVVRHVRDFVDFVLIRWPTFNFADVFLCLGVAFVGLALLGQGKKQVQSASQVE